MHNKTALISGFARSFVSGWPIVGGTVTVLEDTSLTFTTDVSGEFGPFPWPVGQPITLVFSKEGSLWTGYKTTQTPTLIVPEEGINDANFLKNISFQVPSNIAYRFLALTMGLREEPQACQIAATVIPPNITMDDIPQGVADVTVSLSPAVASKPYYFAMFPLIHKTNPFVRTLTATSQDGGVLFPNVPPGEYVMEAQKEGVSFSRIKIKARPGMLVNASPPHGPTLQSESPAALAVKKHHLGFFKPALVVGLATASILIAQNTWSSNSP